MYKLLICILSLTGLWRFTEGGRSCPSQSRLNYRSFHKWCFAFLDDPMSWQQARQICERSGGDLAKIETAAENGFAATLINNQPNAWIGLSDRLVERKFNWTDRTGVSYTNWAPGRPSRFSGSTMDCVVIQTNSMWSDYNCWRSRAFICETDSVATCCPIDAPDNVIASTNETSEGTTVHFSCAAGYYLANGDRTRTCQENEVWSGVTPTCWKMDCGNPGPIQNGGLSGSTLYGGQMKVKCKPGFTISSGNDTVTCGPDGRWLGKLATCSASGGSISKQVSNEGAKAASWYLPVIGISVVGIVITVAVFLWFQRRSLNTLCIRKGGDVVDSQAFSKSTGSVTTGFDNNNYNI